MKRDCFALFQFILLLIKICFISVIKADFNEDAWLEPDAWARDHLVSNNLKPVSGKCCKCSEEYYASKEPSSEQPQTTTEDVASIVYFKKYVTILFNRKNFKYDSSQKLYKRSIVFTAHSHQMDKLEQLQDPRDLDNILTEIFDNVHDPNMYCDGQQLHHTRDASTGIKTIVINIFFDVWQLLNTSELRFLMAVTIVILIAWIINNRFKIGFLPLVFGGIFIFGYFYTYLECNRELEVNQMLEILDRNNGNGINVGGIKMLTFFKGMFYGDDDQILQQQKIRQSAKLSLGFCRPDHVLIMYFSDIFIKYLQILIEQCTAAITTLNGILGFPYNLFSGFFFIYLIGYILKLSFKYILSPSAWVQYMHRKRSMDVEQETIKSTVSFEADRISGDNLKLLLNAANAALQRVAVAPTFSAAAVSGVEDVRENMEPSLEKTSPIEAITSEKSPDNDSNGKPLDEKNDVKLEDLFDDS